MIDSYIAIDLETTGLQAKLEKITEIAALKVLDGVVMERLVTLINPKRKLGERITKLTGITDEMLTEAPVIEDVIQEVIDFCGELPLLGHNIIFDYGFLKRAAVNSGMTFKKDGIDTLTLCRTFMPGDTKRNLGSACSFYEISQSAAHRAEADAEAAHWLYQKLKRLHSEDKPQLFTAKPLIYKAKREQPSTKRQKDYLRDLAKCHRINITVQIDTMSRNEASRMIDSIISQYGRMSDSSVQQK